MLLRSVDQESSPGLKQDASGGVSDSGIMTVQYGLGPVGGSCWV